MRTTTILIMSFFCLNLFACSKNDNIAIEPEKTDTMKLKITVNNTMFTATLQNNETAKAFKDLLPLTLNMAELNNNEKFTELPNSLPTNASNPGTIQNGDLMLYGSNTLVLFYKTFSTSYTYTKIGRIDNPDGLKNALGSSNASIKFELE